MGKRFRIAHKAAKLQADRARCLIQRLQTPGERVTKHDLQKCLSILGNCPKGNVTKKIVSAKKLLVDWLSVMDTVLQLWSIIPYDPSREDLYARSYLATNAVSVVQSDKSEACYYYLLREDGKHVGIRVAKHPPMISASELFYQVLASPGELSIAHAAFAVSKVLNDSDNLFVVPAPDVPLSKITEQAKESGNERRTTRTSWYIRR